MAQLTIDGKVASVKNIFLDGAKNYDSLLYFYRGTYYSDIRELFNILLKEQNYEKLKDYNECLFWVESNTNLVTQRTHYPMNMQIEHTSFCNARCIMCFHYYYQNQMATNMDEHIYSKCRKWLPFVRTVGLHGFGEPFLTPGLQKYLDDYHYYGIKLYTNTNLSIIPPYLDEYYSDFQFINISCDGATKEVFEGIRQNVSFDEFIKNVKILRKEGSEVQLVFAVVLMRQNIHQCEEIVRLAATLGIDKVMFSKIGINYVIGNYEDSVDKYPETLRTNLRLAHETGRKLGIKVIVPCHIEELYENIDRKKYIEEQAILKRIPFWKYSRKVFPDGLNHTAHTNMQLEREVSYECFMPSGRKIKGICDWLTNNIYVSATGRVGFCCSNFKYFIGDLTYEELDDIWKGIHYRKIIESFRAGELPHFCRNCNLLNKEMLPGVSFVK